MEENSQEQPTQNEITQPQEESKAELKPEKAGWFSFKKKQKEEAKPEAEKKSGFGSKIKGKLVNYRRVIEVAKKPDKEEFISSAKITAIGIALLGAVGLVIFLIFALVR